MGDNDSVSIANIAMRFIMLSASETLQTCELVKRFIDDIMIIFIGTLQEAETLKNTLEQKFANEGLKIIYRHVHAESEIKEVEFLDVNHVIDAEDPVRFITKDFVKPTAVGKGFLERYILSPNKHFQEYSEGRVFKDAPPQ